MEDIKETETELLQVKITMCEIKNILDGINGRVDNAEEKTSKLKGIAIEIIQTNTERKIIIKLLKTNDKENIIYQPRVERYFNVQSN